MREWGCARIWTAPINRGSARHSRFLAGNHFPAAHVIVQIDMNHAILPREITPISLSSRAPGAGNHGGGTIDADVNVRSDETGVFGFGILDAGNQSAPIHDFAGWRSSNIVVVVDALKEAGIVQGHGVSGF